MRRTLFSTPERWLSRLAIPSILLVLPLACGGSDSNPPPVVAPAPTISIQPKGAVLYEGHAFSLSVTAAGDSLTYQWMNGTTKIAGATTNTYAKTSAATTDSGNITVVVSNAGGDKTSSAAALTVLALPAKAVAMPLISLNAPAFASSGAAATAVDSTGNTQWQPSAITNSTTPPKQPNGNYSPSGAYVTPAWIALDLSGVDAAKRATIMVQWSTFSTYQYEASLKSWDVLTWNMITDYTLDASNAAAGSGTTPPAENDASWKTLLPINGNDYHSRQHLVNFTGYNWLRLRILGGNSNPSLNLEVHDASAAGADDSWLLLGDSIAAFAYRQAETLKTAADLGPNIATLVNTGNSIYTPVIDNGGIGGMTAADAVQMTSGVHDDIWTGSPIDRWLTNFPGKYVALAYGTNDVNYANLTATDIDAIVANFKTLSDKIIAANKIPVIPHMVWSAVPNVIANGPLLNAKLDALIASYNGQVLIGPDLWGALAGRNDVFTGVTNSDPTDKLHPDPAGLKLMREAWAKAMLETIYRP